LKIYIPATLTTVHNCQQKWQFREPVLYRNHGCISTKEEFKKLTPT
jgi:hypothetical protein